MSISRARTSSGSPTASSGATIPPSRVNCSITWAARKSDRSAAQTNESPTASATRASSQSAISGQSGPGSPASMVASASRMIIRDRSRRS